MLQNPMDILTRYPIRKTQKQKTEFLLDAVQFAESLHYPVQVEKGSRGVRNIVIGDPSRAKYLVTAHYDTPASIGLPNFITPNNPVLYFLIQLLLVGIMIAVSVGVGYGVSLLLHATQFAFLTAYLTYVGLLLLMLMGPANRNNANDNTSGVVTILEIASSLPENLRSRVAFVLFDLEEQGLVGSAVYKKMHKAQIQNQVVLNLDCVGDGDVIQLSPVSRYRKNEVAMKFLETICGQVGKKRIQLRSKGFTGGNSDHKHFPNGVGIMAFRHKKGIGLYCGRIHTWRDTILDKTNVNILRAAIISLISADIPQNITK